MKKYLNKILGSILIYLGLISICLTSTFFANGDKFLLWETIKVIHAALLAVLIMLTFGLTGMYLILKKNEK